MAIWIAKAFVQKIVSFLPYKHNLNRYFQKHLTKGLNLTDSLFECKINHCNQHIAAYRKFRPGKENFSTLELGTGWFPVVPLGMFLCNSSAIYSVDIEPLLDLEKTRITLRKYIEYHNSGKLQELLPLYDKSKIVVFKSILDNNSDIGEIKRLLRLNIIIGDLLNQPLLKGIKVDLIHSNNTLEHIPEKILKEILNYFKSIISNDGVMSHFIDMSDHFSHLDKNITAYNYLKFSDFQWKMIDNSIQPQNRLRISDYKRIYKETGWLIKHEMLSHGNIIDLESVKLSSKYKLLGKTDLSVTYALLVS